MSVLSAFSAEFIAAMSRAITGRLYSDRQIQTITSGAIGKYFQGFIPAPKEQMELENRVATASKHIETAGAIIRDMQSDLAAQDQKLEELLNDIEQKKQLADRYQAIASTNKEAFQAFREEMEIALRQELKEQAEKGKLLRRIASFGIWLITLFAGAALGTYFNEIVNLL